MKRVATNELTCKRLLRVRRATVFGAVGNIIHRIENKLRVFMEDAGRHCGRRRHLSSISLEDANPVSETKYVCVLDIECASSKRNCERCARLPQCLPASSTKTHNFFQCGEWCCPPSRIQLLCGRESGTYKSIYSRQHVSQSMLITPDIMLTCYIAS